MSLIKEVTDTGLSRNPIIMLNRYIISINLRGNCSFVQKVKNVEAIGGRIALIVNNEEGELKLFMTDDGTGSDLTIPGVLIRKSEGDLIRNFIKNNSNNSEIINHIVLEINFEMVISLMNKEC